MNVSPAVLSALPFGHEDPPSSHEEWSDATGIDLVVSHVWPHSERDDRVFNGWVALIVGGEWLLDFEVQMWENGDITMPRQSNSKSTMLWLRHYALRTRLQACIADHLRATKAGKPRVEPFRGDKYPPKVQCADRPVSTGDKGWRVGGLPIPVYPASTEAYVPALPTTFTITDTQQADLDDIALWKQEHPLQDVDLYTWRKRRGEEPAYVLAEL